MIRYDIWTINLKSFEIIDELEEARDKALWTINLKSFEIILYH